MKKHSSLFISLTLLMLIACSKYRPVPDPPYDVIIQPATIDDLNNSVDTSVISFTPLQTNAQNASFFLTGLPPGITIDSSQLTQGVPPFSTMIIFKNNGRASSGTYTIKVNCYSSVTRNIKSYDLSLRVLPAANDSNCAIRASGYWTRCRRSADTSIFSNYAAIDRFNPNWVDFANGSNMGYGLQAILDCTNGTLSIAHLIRIDASGTHYFSGTGTFSANLITYSLQDSMSTGIQRYNIVMRR